MYNAAVLKLYQHIKPKGTSFMRLFSFIKIKHTAAAHAVLIAVLMMTVALLGGCMRFDRSAYVTAMLDSIYKGQHEEYAAMTKLSEEELEQNYEEGMNAEIEKLLSYMNISNYASFVDEDTRSHIREFFMSVYQYADYTVGDADQMGNINVTITPIEIFAASKDELDAYVEDYFARNDAGEFASLTQEEFYSRYIQGVLDILSTHTDTITYGESKNIIVCVKASNHNVYSITEDELSSIDQAIIDYAN